MTRLRAKLEILTPGRVDPQTRVRLFGEPKVNDEKKGQGGNTSTVTQFPIPSNPGTATKYFSIEISPETPFAKGPLRN